MKALLLLQLAGLLIVNNPEKITITKNQIHMPAPLSDKVQFPIYYKTINIDGLDIFYREAGPANAPVLLLLHGYPGSSFMYRNLITLLKNEFHIIAPDYPGFGFSSFPPKETFNYTFDQLSIIMEHFVDALDIHPFSMYVQDYGAPVGMRLATRRPDWLNCLIIQNGNAYAEGLGESWNDIKTFWKNPGVAENRKKIMEFFELPVTKFQYLAGVMDTSSVSPESYWLDQFLLNRPGNKEMQLDLMYDYRKNIEVYPQWQSMLRLRQPPTLVVWGENDPFFTKTGALAYQKDIKHIEYHFYPTGHFALEEQCDAIAVNVLSFLRAKTKK